MLSIPLHRTNRDANSLSKLSQDGAGELKGGAATWVRASLGLQVRHLVADTGQPLRPAVGVGQPPAATTRTILRAGVPALAGCPRDPVWGVLLQSAQNTRSIVDYPWTLIPTLFVIDSVLAFNFAGDRLRDAADFYSRT